MSKFWIEEIWDEFNYWWMKYVVYEWKWVTVMILLDFLDKETDLFIQWILSTGVESVQEQLNVPRPLHLQTLKIKKYFKYEN